ncbi:MAG: M50 family metallopeptidase [Acidobacteriota bacterium]
MRRREGAWAMEYGDAQPRQARECFQAERLTHTIQMSTAGSRIDAKELGVLLGVFVAVAALWGTPVVTPLKILVVLLHEISHGIAAVLTGGEILQMVVDANQGGRCWVQGGNLFVILTAGYLGSMLWGALILIVAARTRYDRAVSAAIGLFLLIITLLYVRSAFGFSVGLLFSVAMIMAAWKLPVGVNDIVLKVIGITSCLYAILDIIDDVLRRPGIGSDADMLASHTGIPSLVWGSLWVAAAIAAALTSLWIAAKGERRSTAPTVP